MLSAGEQIAILLKYGVDYVGVVPRLTEIQAATGIKPQILQSLIRGTNTNPRLNTVRTLCDFYGITLDYFMCETEEACRAFLVKHQQATGIGAIADGVDHLTPTSQNNLSRLVGVLEQVVERLNGRG